MFWRLTYSNELVLKIILFIVIAVVLLNIYILSVIFSSEDVKFKHHKNDGVIIKPQPIKKFQHIHGFKQSTKKAVFVQTNTTQLATKKILEMAVELGRQSFKHIFSSKIKRSYQAMLDNVKLNEPTSSEFLKESLKWVNGRQLFPETSSPPIGQVLNSLCSSRIEKADNMVLGTQLKLLLTLEGGLQAVFKPQWYKRTEVITGDVYAGKDRHNGEVAAFHLSWLLGVRRVPLTVGRRINLLQEIIPVASPELLETFLQGNNTCFYGVCYYCRAKDPVCASGNILEGALILLLPQDFPLKKFRHPWQRTYSKNIPARWELDANFCQVVRKTDAYSRGPRLLDIIDTAIFDFLISNGDRHHYECFQNINDSAVLLIDNGKSFGNPFVDHIDILAPLYQCCRVRSGMWMRLLWLRAGSLSDSLRALLGPSHIAPVLTEPHLAAIDRRLRTVMATVQVCATERNGLHNVIVAD